MSIRELRPDDWSEVRAIYAESIRSGDATFETEPASWERWDAARYLLDPAEEPLATPTA